MKKKIISFLGGLSLLLVLTFTFQSCERSILDDVANNGEDLSYEVLQEFDQNDLENIVMQLRAEGYEVSDIEYDQDENNTKFLNNLLLRAIKVTTRMSDPNLPGGELNISGVLLVPKCKTKQLRIVVAPVPTYTSNNQAPSKLFARGMSYFTGCHFNYLNFWTIQAYQGFAVLLPDYPGFGDSYNQCFMPYMMREPLVNSTIELTKAAQSVLTANGYCYKREILLTGFSLGGYVATSMARELENNPNHNLEVKLVVAGAAPADLKNMVDAARTSSRLCSPEIVPYILCGYKNNGYININLADYLKQPYASNAMNYFNGTHADVSRFFTSKVCNLFTQNFIRNFDSATELSIFKNALIENSIQPWANRCEIVMIHSTSDETVCYEGTRNFVSRQNSMGGRILLHSIPCVSHKSTITKYYADASYHLLRNK